MRPEASDDRPFHSTRFIDALVAYCQSAVGGERGLLAIDGRGCSGKSTLATQLADALGTAACVIGVDSFFTPFDQQRPGSPASLYHLRWQEFRNAIRQLRQVGSLSYRPYDWESDALLSAQVIDSPLVIVEGLYAMHRDVCGLYDARIWVEADLATRWDRVLARDGPALIDRWRDEWVPMEQRYLDEQRPWRQADVVVAGISLEVYQLGRALGEVAESQRRRP